jgi:hypothetical protein
MTEIQGNKPNEPVGLDGTPEKDFPGISAAGEAQRPIERLEPKSPLHAKVLNYAIQRLEDSERAMRKFYPRWQAAEKRTQAYINLVDWEAQLKEMNDSGEPPGVVRIDVPYTYATISTIVTYMLHTFFGRKPIFQVGAYKEESMAASRMMEQVLQYNADHTRLIKHGFQFLQDGEMYGLGILRTLWKKEIKQRTVWTKSESRNFFGDPTASGSVKTKETRTTYAGNDVASIDPFLFFPDPRVAMADVNRKGEFVFWRTFIGQHAAKKEQAQGVFKWVDAAVTTLPRNENTNDSSRDLLSRGDSMPGSDLGSIPSNKLSTYMQFDQGTIEIIPAELGLGESTTPEKWLFGILNKSQVVQCEPLNLDHDMHPVAISEPYTMGYGFGQPGISDYLAPMQDTLSWLINSHITNVRTAVNNMFVVDPSAIEMQDVLNPDAGKVMRLKESAMGRDIKTVIQQLPVQDITANHLKDFELFSKMADGMSSVTDNLRGLQDSGGRKTATEVRTSGEAGASRLAAHTRLISAQAMVDLAEQMAINNQQFLEDAFYFSIVGNQGRQTPIHIQPEQLVGDFYFPVNDGTLPIDRVAMLDVWKEVFLAVAQDQELRQQFSIAALFEHVAELGGAKNLDQFKVQINPVPDQQLQNAAQAGNVAPLQAISGLAPGV